MTLLDALTRTHWHVARAARDGVPIHRRLEQATMTDKIATILQRLDEARNRAKSFGLSDDERDGDDFDRAIALRRSAYDSLVHLASGHALALDSLSELAADAHDMIRELAAENARLRGDR